MKPVVSLVGRPNVGKSTLFNRLTRSRAALVADFPGLTRDRHYGEGRIGQVPYLVIDTGGFEPVAAEGIVREMAAQAEQAIAESDVVVFVLDAREGLTAHDRRHLCPEQLDRPHDHGVLHRAEARLNQEAVVVEDVELEEDLLRHLFR